MVWPLSQFSESAILQQTSEQQPCPQTQEEREEVRTIIIAVNCYNDDGTERPEDWTQEEVRDTLSVLEAQVESGEPLHPKHLARLLPPIRHHRLCCAR